jgi:ferric-dicitrate binding protein FerR (iron transport regulator)
MNRFSEDNDSLDVPDLWRALEELEEGTLEPLQCGELEALLERSPAARRAYLEYFQQSAVLRMEAAKLHERGLMPLVGSAVQTRRSIQRSVFAAAALVALAAVVASLIAISRPDPAHLAAVVSLETRWSIDGVAQDSGSDPVTVVEGSNVRVLSGTVRLQLESGDLMVLQSPADVAFPGIHRPQLRQGWLWIDAVKSDKPFQVEAAGLRIRDIGTRFGVRVPTEGPVEVHLVEGRVEVLASKSGKMLGDLKEGGKAFAFTTKGKGEELLLTTDPFPDLPSLLKQPANYRTTVLGQAPAGYWPLDEPQDGVLFNQIRESSSGFLGQAVRAGEPGPGREDGFPGFPGDNRSIYLDGSPEQSVVAGIDGLHGVRRKEGAVSFWIRRSPREAGRNEILWLAGLGQREDWLPTQAILQTYLTATGRLVFEIENGDDDVFLSSSRNIIDERWHQVVASWGPSSVDLYIDGRLAARDNEPRTLEEANLRGRFVRFGKPSLDLKHDFHAFTGWVDEIALWDRPLSATEVDCKYQSAVDIAED